MDEAVATIDKALADIWQYNPNPKYTRFDYQKQVGWSDAEVKKIHTCTVDKTETGLMKLLPFGKNPLCGLQLDMSDEKRIIVTGMKILSPFCKTRLEVGMTIFAINGVFEFENVEQAEQVVDEAPDIVTIIAGEMKDGLLTEFTTIGEIDHHKK